MSKEYEGQNPLDIAARAKKDMNSLSNKTGAGKSSDSGKFPQSPHNSITPSSFVPMPHCDLWHLDQRACGKEKKNLISQI